MASEKSLSVSISSSSHDGGVHMACPATVVSVSSENESGTSDAVGNVVQSSSSEAESPLRAAAPQNLPRGTRSQSPASTVVKNTSRVATRSPASSSGRARAVNRTITPGKGSPKPKRSPSTSLAPGAGPDNKGGSAMVAAPLYAGNAAGRSSLRDPRVSSRENTPTRATAGARGMADRGDHNVSDRDEAMVSFGGAHAPA